MKAAVIFPDIVAATITFLSTALASRSEDYTDAVTVTNEYRGETPARQVVIARDGGPRMGLLEQPRIRINIWAEDDATVTDLSLMCLALIMAWPDGNPVVQATQFTGPTEVDEPNGRSRRFVLVELLIRGSQLIPA